MHTKWTFDIIMNEALKYRTKLAFQKNSPNAYAAAFRRGIVDSVCAHMDKIYKKWNIKSILEIARKYESKSEFIKNSPAYAAAIRYGILKDTTSHMNKKWTEDLIIEKASQCSSRLEFKTTKCAAYKAAQKLGIIDKVCAHMKKCGGTSSLEERLMHTIRKYYSKAQKLRDRQVNIIGKPHIKGFDLDIYVPELRKAIEFDGKYWHSAEGLRRSRGNWSKEDIENYHQIKDEYFKEKGIEVLHVSEINWLEDQEKQIVRCLKFLKCKKEKEREKENNGL